MNIIEILEMKELHLKQYLFDNADYSEKNWSIWKGSESSPFMLVSHLDTIWRRGVELIVQGDIIKNCAGVLGADDRAGVYAALQIYQSLPEANRPWLLFTDFEENGCIGAKEAAASYTPEENIYLLIGLDRPGSRRYSRAAGYDFPQEVDSYIASFGFRKGSFINPEVSSLSVPWKIPAVNLSIGYCRHHTDREFLSISRMNMTIEEVKLMTENPIPCRYEIVEHEWPPIPPTSIFRIPIWRKYLPERLLANNDSVAEISELSLNRGMIESVFQKAVRFVDSLDNLDWETLFKFAKESEEENSIANRKYLWKRALPQYLIQDSINFDELAQINLTRRDIILAGEYARRLAEVDRLEKIDGQILMQLALKECEESGECSDTRHIGYSLT